MPVVIKEMVVKVNVKVKDEESSKSGKTNNETIVAQCVAQVMNLIKDKAER